MRDDDLVIVVRVLARMLVVFTACVAVTAGTLIAIALWRS